MAIDIMQPTQIINALFGNLYFFGAIIAFVYLYVAARYRFNLQLTVMGFVTIFLLTASLVAGFSAWVSFIVVGIIGLLTYVFWRYIATK